MVANAGVLAGDDSLVSCAISVLETDLLVSYVLC